MKAPTKDELEAALNTVEQYAGKTADVFDDAQGKVNEFNIAFSTLTNALGAQTERLKDMRARLSELDGDEAAKMEKRIAREQAYSEFRSNNENKIRDALKETAELRRGTQDAFMTKFAADQNAVDKAYADGITKTREGGTAVGGMLNVVGTGVNNFVQGATQGIANLDQIVALNLMKTLTGVGGGLSDLVSKTQGLGPQVEAANISFAKSLGLVNPVLSEINRGAVDVRSALNAGADFERFGGLVTGTGMTVENANKQMMDLLQSSAEFRKLVADGDKDAAMAMVNYGTALGQLGVTNDNVSKTFDFLTRVQGGNTESALEATMTHVNMAKQLGIGANQMFTDYTSLGDTLAAFGGDANDVFYDLQVVATKTGVDVNRLNDSMLKLDTFSGATDMAQKFNAVLAETGVRISPEKLFMMDPAEKARYLGEKFREAGVFAEGAGKSGRFMARALSEISGVQLPDLKKLAAEPGALETTAAAFDKLPTPIGEFSKTIKSGLSSTELLTRELPNLVSGMDTMVQNVRGPAEEFGSIWNNVFGESLRLTGNNTDAVAAFLFSLKALGEVTSLIDTAKEIPAIGSLVSAATGLVGVAGMAVRPSSLETLTAGPGTGADALKIFNRQSGRPAGTDDDASSLLVLEDIKKEVKRQADALEKGLNVDMSKAVIMMDGKKVGKIVMKQPAPL